MSLHATFIEHTFVSILALYVTLECAVTILQTRAAEKSCGRVPEGFEKKLTLAGIRKAADYTGELAQANLLLTVAGAGFALFMTFGNGLNVFTAVIETIMGPGIPADWVLINLIVLLMLLIELPFGWWARYRVKERYGYMREPRMRWLSRTLSEALWGWLVFMPVSAALLTIFEYAGGDWWKLAWGVWLVYLLWRWKLSSVYGVFCWLAGWGATHVQFFEGFNYSPMLTLDMPGTHAGSVCAVALIVFPMLLYPLSPLLNLAARLMQYDADLHAARIAGLDPMISALVKLHKDTTTSLSPSLVYSLFHYKRPHPGMRVANLQRLKRLSAPGGRLEHLFPKPAEPRAPEAD